MIYRSITPISSFNKNKDFKKIDDLLGLLPEQWLSHAHMPLYTFCLQISVLKNILASVVWFPAKIFNKNTISLDLLAILT
jgi:hypothetical protein